MSDPPFDIRETYAAQEGALAKIWDDSALDVYNEDHVDGRSTGYRYLT